MDLQQLVLGELRVLASYIKCYRAKEKAIKDMQGTEDDSYLKLSEHLHCLKLANPGTIDDFQTEKDEDGMERFLYLLLAFRAFIERFRKLRCVLILDGTHLSGKYKGVLLSARGQDKKIQEFTLAFGGVDSENDAAWT